MRTRLLFPEFFTDEKILSLTPADRLLFQALWLMADRNGLVEDKPFEIWMKVGITDYKDKSCVDESIQRINDMNLITRYEVNELKIIKINNFLKYQKPHIREAQSKLPCIEHATGLPKANLGTPKADLGTPKADLGTTKDVPRLPVLVSVSDPVLVSVSDPPPPPQGGTGEKSPVVIPPKKKKSVVEFTQEETDILNLWHEIRAEWAAEYAPGSHVKPKEYIKKDYTSVRSLINKLKSRNGKQSVIDHARAYFRFIHFEQLDRETGNPFWPSNLQTIHSVNGKFNKGASYTKFCEWLAKSTKGGTDHADTKWGFENLTKLVAEKTGADV